MADLIPQYAFEGDEIFALHEGKVIASGTDMKDVESDATDYLSALRTERDQVERDQAKKQATHIVTPGGLKGQILGRTPTMWGEQITARFENGHIAHFETHGEGYEWVSERTASTAANPAEGLEQRLAATFSRDRASLATRHAELGDIAKTAFSLLRAGAPYAIEIKLDQVRTAAEVEARQVKEALDHLDSADAETFSPPTHQVVEQADLGHSTQDANWLDVITQDMIVESEGQDFDKLLSEGPALFVTDLDTGALADSGVTREMAHAHVVSKTAGFQGDDVDQYRESFLARVEVARRGELAGRKETNHKEAAAEQEVQSNAPDEALFM